MFHSGYETVQQAAERLGVTPRAIQKWAASGRLAGARKLGRTWYIPIHSAPDAAPGPDQPSQEQPVLFPTAHAQYTLPLMSASFLPGEAQHYIDSLPDPDSRAIATGEYFYYCGRCEEAAKIAELYLDSHNPALRYSASLISIFSNLALGHIHVVSHVMQLLHEGARSGLLTNSAPELHALAVLALTTTTVQLDLTEPIPPLEDYLRFLPIGLKLWGCFLLSQQAYFEKSYERSLAIAQLAIALSPQDYPIAQLHMKLSCAIALINLRRMDEARDYMDQAWTLAQRDGLVQVFAEHHGFLQGMVEVFFKKRDPQLFNRIISTTNSYNAGWRSFHNQQTGKSVTNNLTTTEFTVAMLYNRGWSAQEISKHLSISEHTVRSYIKTIYIKLGISDRNGLSQYMLR